MATGIKSVSCFTASGPTQTCDRCNADIRHVAVVTWKDGTSRRFGLECVNRILNGDTSLVGLFRRNAKLAEKYAHWLDVLGRDAERIPRGSEYYGSGLYFIADDQGRDIMCGGRFSFHPLFDVEKNQAGDRYVRCSAAAWRAKSEAAIREQVDYLTKETERISGFLARVLAKGLINAPVA